MVTLGWAAHARRPLVNTFSYVAVRFFGLVCPVSSADTQTPSTRQVTCTYCLHAHTRPRPRVHTYCALVSPLVTFRAARVRVRTASRGVALVALESRAC